jgi:hypothetical protein
MRAWILVVGLAACSRAPMGPPDDLDEDLPRPAARSRELYTLWWNGARIGDVEEQLSRGDGGVELVRSERVQVMRGDRLAGSRLELVIRADAALVASAVSIESYSDGGAWSGTAQRRDDGRWRLHVDGEPDRIGDADAVPAELVPLIVARDGRFDGEVLLAGSAFATAALTVERDGDEYVGTLAVPGGTLVTRLRLERDGSVIRAAGADGVVAVRAALADVRAPFDPPEVVDGTAIPVKGTVAEDAAHVSLAIAPMPDEPPPALPGQVIAIDAGRWHVVLDPALPGGLDPLAASADRTEDIGILVHDVDVRVADDLAVTVTTMDAARKATAGDCTTHALLFAALAADAGIEARLVTGFRLDGALLVRHRWAIAWTGSAWMSVDPTHGEAPTRGFVLGLAIHGARADEVALADTVTFAGTGGARASATR